MEDSTDSQQSMIGGLVLLWVVFCRITTTRWWLWTRGWGKSSPNRHDQRSNGGENIKDLLCKAKLPPLRKINTRSSSQKARNGVTRCNKGLDRNTCICCPFITSRPDEVVRTVTLFSTGQEIAIEGVINCKTKGGFLYLLWSSKAPMKQYLGSCIREPRDRSWEHRRDIGHNKKDKALAKHCHETGNTLYSGRLGLVCSIQENKVQ